MNFEMDSHKHGNKRANHITDTFFFEELSNIIGCQASYEWLQTNSAKRRKCISSTIPSSQASKQSTPQPSAASTPRRLSLIQTCPLCVSVDVQETLDQVPRESPPKSEEAQVDAAARQNHQILPSRTGALDNTSQHRINLPDTCLQPRRHSLIGEVAPDGPKSGMLDRIGLLYTDAAHSVLEDRDVAHYIEHSIRPIP